MHRAERNRQPTTTEFFSFFLVSRLALLSFRDNELSNETRGLPSGPTENWGGEERARKDLRRYAIPSRPFPSRASSYDARSRYENRG